MSANKTVTCFRSPSMNLRDARIFSARYLGTTVLPEEGSCVLADIEAGSASSRWPHFLQNLALGRFGSWQ